VSAAARAAVLSLLVATAATACGDEDAPADGPAAIPSDVERVLVDRCQPCHSDPVTRYAPMPIVDWAQVQEPTPTDPALAVFEMIELRIASEGYPMPPKNSPELEAFTDTEQQILLDWVQNGAPSAD